MKKITLVFALFALVTSTCVAQKLNATKVPTVVKSAFTKAHAAINHANWEMENNNYEVGFTLNGKEISEVYAVKGILVETEVQVKPSELPATVLAQLKGKKISETAKITKADGTIIYEAEVRGKDLLFDAKGNPVQP